MNLLTINLIGCIKASKTLQVVIMRIKAVNYKKWQTAQIWAVFLF